MIHTDPTGTNGACHGSLWNAIKRGRDGLTKRIPLQDERLLNTETVDAVRELAMNLAKITREDAVLCLMNQNFPQLCGSLTALIQGAGLAGVRFLGEVAYAYGIEGRPLSEWFRTVETFEWKAGKRAKNKENNGKLFPSIGISLVGDSTFQFYGEDGKPHRFVKTLLNNELHFRCSGCQIQLQGGATLRDLHDKFEGIDKKSHWLLQV